jgi:hypothetical protein
MLCVVWMQSPFPCFEFWGSMARIRWSQMWERFVMTSLIGSLIGQLRILCSMLTRVHDSMETPQIT